MTTGTAQIFRLPQVQDAITRDFIVLPCDLISELPGSSLLETWMVTQAGLGDNGIVSPSGRRGGLGVWYETRDVVPEGGIGVKKEETDFLATTQIQDGTPPAPQNSLRARVRNIVMTMPTDTLKDTMDDKGALNIRHQLLRKHSRVRMLTTHRDAHIYLLPYWVKDFIKRNDTFESFGEDVLGWWAKAGWQSGLADKLQFSEALRKKRRKSEPANGEERDGVDIATLSSTTRPLPAIEREAMPAFATRVGNASPQSPSSQNPTESLSVSQIPPLLAYIHPAPTSITTEDSKDDRSKQQRASQSSSTTAAAASKSGQQQIPLVRRTDTVPLLLSISLYLARLPSIADLSQPLSSSTTPPSSLAHAHKAHPTSTLPSQSTIDLRTVLIDANCTLSPRITLRECVIGASVSIASGARLTRCIVMEGAVIDEKAVLTGCILGRRCRIGKGADLRDCSVEEKYIVTDGMSAKGEVMAGFDEGGLAADGDGEISDAEDLIDDIDVQDSSL